LTTPGKKLQFSQSRVYMRSTDELKMQPNFVVTRLLSDIPANNSLILSSFLEAL